MTAFEGKKGKVLIVSSYFPPQNNMGAVRVGKFAKYLPHFGWEVIVLTASGYSGEAQTLHVETDEANVVRTRHFDLVSTIQRRLFPGDEISSQIPVPGTKGRLRRGLIHGLVTVLRPVRRLSIINLLFFAGMGWRSYGVERGEEILKKHKVDVIFSSHGPPVSHFIASYLQKKAGIPWVAEFRDHWSLNHNFIKIQPFHFLLQWLERRTLWNSSLLITVSEPMAKELKALHSKEVAVISNGFDDEDYRENIPLSTKFTITYTGNIYPGKQDPTPLFEAIAELHRISLVCPKDFELRFFGKNVADSVSSLIRNYRLEELVKIYGFVPFGESIRRQKESTVLWLLGWNDPREKGVYTGKIFEYLGARRPILAIGLKQGVMDSLLTESGAGILLNKAGEIKALLERWLGEVKTLGEIKSYYRPKEKVISKYTRKRQAEQLAHLLNKVT
ncbi:MAG: glycosyltransferase [Dehalococcoidia bacterium]|nr:glycosyltransferase [Dehalococcoidia bacterium]